MKTLQELQNESILKSAKLDEELAKDNKDIKIIKSLSAEIDVLASDISDAKELAVIEKKRLEIDVHPVNFTVTKSDKFQFKAPSTSNMRVKNFAKHAETHEEAITAAYGFGQIVKAIYGGDASDRTSRLMKAVDLGVMTKAQVENSNSAGGFLVPPEYADYIVHIMEDFGVFRANSRLVNMSSDMQLIPRAVGNVIGYWQTDGMTITPSQLNFDRITLSAKKYIALALISNELNDDSIINIADLLIENIAYITAFNEDYAAFNGNGTSLYGDIVGLSGAFTKYFPNVNSSTAGAQGGVWVGESGTGTSWSNFTMQDFTSMKRLVPSYVESRGKAKWYCSKQFYNAVMEQLQTAAGGNTMLTIANGTTGNTKMFLNDEVVFTQVLPTVPSASSAVAYYGDLSLSSTVGVRSGIVLDTSDQYMFGNDEIAVRGKTRTAITNHDVGGNQANTLVQNPSYDQSGNTYYGGPVCQLLSYSS